MTHWAVVLYTKGKPPLFRVFPNSVKAYIYASWFIPGEYSILPVTKVEEDAKRNVHDRARRRAKA